MLNEEIRNSILELQKQYPQRRSALIPALHLAQMQEGYLPREIQDEVAALFNIDPNEVNAVVTFYDMFFEEPTGKHILHVCKNVSCMLRGGDGLLSRLCHKLRIAPGGTTEDEEFTVIASECLGACDRAPMMIVDDKVVGPVNPDDLDKILEEAKKGPGHPCPAELLGGSHG
ncbi:MAG: NADH-quinone oxidoreductase subunit NuoE [Parachlamydiales bacterium]|jgi:NADH-quinone oxidoreductase subunit E